MKKYLLFFILFSIVATAQKVYFPKENLKDSITRSVSLPKLAEQLIPLYKNDDKITYYDNLFRLQFIAKKYSQMESTLNKFCYETAGDSMQVALPGSGYRIVVKTLQSNPKNKTEFEDAYFKNVKDFYYSLYPSARMYLSDYLIYDLKQYTKEYEKLISAAQTKDSLDIDEAVLLCRKYASYWSISKTNSIAEKTFRKIEAEIYKIEDVVIPMSDGGTIAVTVVRSETDTNKKPVVLMYNIYAGYDESKAKNINYYDFVGVIANTRGKRTSKDAIEPFEYDAKDAYEIIDWISKQEWCNGKVGMYGGSYLGFSQWSATKKMHPALKTIVPQVAVGIGIDFPMHNGIFNNYMLRWIHYVTNNKTVDYDDFGNDEKWAKTQKQYFTTGYPFSNYDKEEGRPSAVFQKWLQHPTYDSFWQNMTPQKEEFAAITIPILTITGYYDDDQLGALHYFKEHQKWFPNNNHYLLIGPFDHYGAQGYPSKQLNGYTLDERAVLEIEELVFDWFNYTLKDGKKPAILSDKVNFEVMGQNKWMHVANLDEMHNATMALYLSKNKLVKQKPSNGEFIQQTIDFKDRSEVEMDGSTEVCGFKLIDDTTLSVEKHHLVYESEPLPESVAISGNLVANLTVSCNKKDMDVTFQVYEKTPDGHYFALSNNMHRLSLVKDRSKRQLLKPNAKESFSLINNYMTSKQLQKGSQIVIVLGVLKNANWQINYGTGKDVSDESIQDAAIPLEVKWYGDSHFVVPVLK